MSEFLFVVFMFMCLSAARDNSYHGVGFHQVLCEFCQYVFFPWIYFSFFLSFLLSSQLLFKQPQLNPQGSTNQQHMLHIFKDFTFSQLKPIPSICLVSYHLIFFAFSLPYPCNCCIRMQTQEKGFTPFIYGCRNIVSNLLPSQDTSSPLFPEALKSATPLSALGVSTLCGNGLLVPLQYGGLGHF